MPLSSAIFAPAEQALDSLARVLEPSGPGVGNVGTRVARSPAPSSHSSEEDLAFDIFARILEPPEVGLVRAAGGTQLEVEVLKGEILSNPSGCVTGGDGATTRGMMLRKCRFFVRSERGRENRATSWNKGQYLGHFVHRSDPQPE